MSPQKIEAIPQLWGRQGQSLKMLVSCFISPGSLTPWVPDQLGVRGSRSLRRRTAVHITITMHMASYFRTSHAVTLLLSHITF